MTTIIFHYLIFISFLFLAREKFKLQEKGANTKYKFIYKLTKCDFCFDFWAGVLTVLFVNIILGSTFSRTDIGLVFAISGLHLLIQKL